MKKSDIYEIAIKILGLYLVVVVIEHLREVLMYAAILLQPNNDPNSFGGVDQTLLFVTILFSFLILTVFVGLLILKTKTISKIISRKEDFEEKATLFADKKTIYEISLILVGLVTVVLTIPDLALQLRNYSKSADHYNTNFLLTGGLKIIVGILAIIYSGSLSSFFAKDKSEPENRLNE